MTDGRNRIGNRIVARPAALDAARAMGSPGEGRPRKQEPLVSREDLRLRVALEDPRSRILGRGLGRDPT